MSIEIPAEELLGLAAAVAATVVPAFDQVAAAAATGTGDCAGVLHQPASSRLEAIIGKLGADARLGTAASGGLSAGLRDVVARFGALDSGDSGGHR
ncbi:MAG: hypothetical protein ABI776_00090 [Nocardioidaceae bacterium]